MEIRTDLALEAHEMCSQMGEEKGEEIDGVAVYEKRERGIIKTKIVITNENGEKVLNKPIGTYVTIEAPDIKYDSEIYKRVCILLSEEIKYMTKIEKSTKTLVVGLGNDKITPDALGPLVVSKLMITSHMSEYFKNDEDISSVCAISPGVLGTTGIETAQIVKGVVKQERPDLIIAIDALAARSIDRISTTFQLSNTGINPGSGVRNKREGLNEKTLGVKVIAIGVPTVVDAKTIASDCIDIIAKKTNTQINPIQESNITKSLSNNIGVLMVTPKDIDSVIEKTSKTVANGINLALHKNLTFEDIESYIQ